MRALILAAGKGTRLKPFTTVKPKPAVEVCGIPLILRTFLSLKGLGIEPAVVVGYRAEEIRKILGEGVKLIQNNDIERGNAYSVLCAREEFEREEKFLLLMGDHLYTPEFLSAASRAPPGSAIVCRENDTIAIDEATKVLAENGKVLDIGKGLENWTHIDTGAFICRKDIFDLLDEIFRNKRSFEWSEAVKMANMRIYEVNEPWTDIDTPEDLPKAEKLLLRSLIKPEDGIISRYINRRISLNITRLLGRFDVNPNHISALSFLIAIISSYLLLSGSYILGGILVQVSSIIDGVDGEIARLRFRKSGFGGFFDTLLDRYADAFILSALFLSIPFSIRNFILYLFALTGTFLVGYSASTFKEAYGMRAERLEGKLRFIPAKRDERLFLISIGSIVGYFTEFAIPVLFLLLAAFTNLRVFGRLLMAGGMEKSTS
ncbi:MAG TPA: CDP-alcohol phosphatidyltransferase [Candidatus Syntrophoarchaeum butanivorans]|uniref:Bifunctional IPC transferase and DIPP synthase n=1 Tax=Candidatus Syntropharchaeum butanivorans TaxID=1839936 RepID=A0A7J2RZD2_9EURY|nr:CDP-alcohol phosphatidyltransferase [Candidatus Syntrophoarchaeum butanivorans]